MVTLLNVAVDLRALLITRSICADQSPTSLTMTPTYLYSRTLSTCFPQNFQTKSSSVFGALFVPHTITLLLSTFTSNLHFLQYSSNSCHIFCSFSADFANITISSAISKSDKRERERERER